MTYSIVIDFMAIFKNPCSLTVQYILYMYVTYHQQMRHKSQVDKLWFQLVLKKDRLGSWIVKDIT